MFLIGLEFAHIYLIKNNCRSLSLSAKMCAIIIALIFVESVKLRLYKSIKLLQIR